MDHWTFVGLVVFAGVMIAFQSPINAALSRDVGVYESAFVSFFVGTVFALSIAIFFGSGSLWNVTRAPWWQLTGGMLGLVVVTALILAVPRIGVTAAMVAILAGQLSTGLLIDQYGWFGVPARPLEWQRLAGVALLFVAIWLISGRK
jgi:transporter family-2 protein